MIHCIAKFIHFKILNANRKNKSLMAVYFELEGREILEVNTEFIWINFNFGPSNRRGSRGCNGQGTFSGNDCFVPN